jgi:hypothetical protein
MPHLPRALTAVFAGLLILLGVVLAPNAAVATHNEWSHCNSFPNLYADQTTTNGYTGIAGRFFTSQPALNIASQYSVSHLYVFRTDTGGQVESGWVRGRRDVNNVSLSSSTLYTAMSEPGSIYSELYFGDAPAGYENYKIENLGIDPPTGKFKWGVFFSAGSFSSVPDHTWYMSSINWGQMVSGGEVSNSIGTHMQVTMQPSHQLLLPSDGQWHDWTDGLMTLNNDTTAICNDNNLFLTYTTRFDNYTASGTVQ